MMSSIGSYNKKYRNNFQHNYTQKKIVPQGNFPLWLNKDQKNIYQFKFNHAIIVDNSNSCRPT